MPSAALPVAQPSVIVNASRDSTISTDAEVASSLFARARGLMLRSSFHDGQALIINPCSSIHMFFMCFPIDVLYLDESGRVVRSQSHIKPWRVGPLLTKHAKYVIELPVGTIERTGTRAGDQIRFT